MQDSNLGRGKGPLDPIKVQLIGKTQALAVY